MDLALLFLLLFCGHTIVAGASLPMARRRIARNRWVGIRTPKTLSDESIWIEANAVAGRLFLRATAASAVTSAILFGLLPVNAALTFSFGVFVVAEGIAVLLAAAALRQIAR